MTRAALLLACLSACCPGPERADYATHGLAVQDDAGIGEDRIEYAVTTALAYWGATDRDLAGWAVVVHDDPHGAVCERSFACAWDCGSIQLSAPVEAPDCPEFALPHEIGHVLLGDHDHVDPRWRMVPWACDRVASSDFMFKQEN